MLKYFIGVILAIAITSGAFLLFGKGGQTIAGTSSYGSTSYSVASSTAYTIGTNTSIRVAATSTARAYLIVQNNSASSVYLNLSDIASTANTGILLNASSTYEIRDYNLYNGSVQAIGTNASASTTVLVTELRF